MTHYNSDLEILEDEDPAGFKEFLRLADKARRETEKTFGGYLGSLRRRVGRTVGEMAHKADVSPSCWANWEADCNLPDADTVWDVMHRLYFPMEEAQKLIELLKHSPRHSFRN